jgi:hypothetical protein
MELRWRIRLRAPYIQVALEEGSTVWKILQGSVGKIPIQLCAGGSVKSQARIWFGNRRQGREDEDLSHRRSSLTRANGSICGTDSV